MLSLYRDSDDTIEFEGETFKIDCNFNVVLANLELSQNRQISEYVKVRTALKNYLDLTDEELNELDYIKQVKLYIAISQKIFGLKEPVEQEEQDDKKEKRINDDKSVYSFSEDADFIFASFMKDYGINLIEKRNNMHWNEFKALFVSLSKDTKIAEVMSIRSWKPKENDSKEHIKDMKKLQRIYALQTTQQEMEQVELERRKMSLMSPEERIAYAKQKLSELEG